MIEWGKQNHPKFRMFKGKKYVMVAKGTPQEFMEHPSEVYIDISNMQYYKRHDKRNPGARIIKNRDGTISMYVEVKAGILDMLAP